jgi:hypothetical protein
MPPFDGYNSVLDGSLRVESSTNSDRYGNGSLIVQNGCNFFGASDQYLKTTSATADLYIQTDKDFFASAPKGTLTVKGLTGATFQATSGNVTVTGVSANLTASTGSVVISGGTSASLDSTAGGVTVTGASSVEVKSTTGSATLTALSGNTTVNAGGTLYFTSNSKSEIFQATATCSSTGSYTITAQDGVATLTSTNQNASLNSTNFEAQVIGKTNALLSGTQKVNVVSASGDATVEATTGTVNLKGIHKTEGFTGSSTATIGGDYTVSSTTGTAKIQSVAKDVLVFGKTLAHVSGDQGVKIESTIGNIQLLGATGVYTQAADITLSANTIAKVNAPTINIVSTTISTLDGPTVEVGKTSTNVYISKTGGTTTVEGGLTVNGTTTTKAINASGDCTITGNLTVTGTTTTINTENLSVKDNIIVLNSAAALGKDAGLLFTRSGPTGAIDSATMFWDESVSSFILATTKSGPESSTLLKEDYSTLTCGDIISKSVSMPNFGTKTVTLGGQSGSYISIDGINKLRGSYEFQIQSALPTGSVYNYKIVKASENAESSSFGVHANGEDGSQVWVKWAPNQPPKFYMKNFSESSANQLFYVNYLTVL